MGEIVVRDDGTLDLDSFASLTRDELCLWLEARLHGQDTLVPDDARQGELPHYLIKRIYPHLDRHSRDYLIAIVRGFLRDMSRNETSTWRGEAAHALLMLAQTLDDRSFADPIREMAQEGRFLEGDARDEDLHRRLLQSLAALTWIGTRNFWHEQVERDPARHAGAAFNGLKHIALKHAIDLLPRLPWDQEEVQRRMRVALRGLLPAYDHSEIGALLSNVLPKLPRPAQEKIRDFLPEIRDFLPEIADSSYTGLPYDLAVVADVLSSLGHPLKPTRPALA